MNWEFRTVDGAWQQGSSVVESANFSCQVHDIPGGRELLTGEKEK